MAAIESLLVGQRLALDRRLRLLLSILPDCNDDQQSGSGKSRRQQVHEKEGGNKGRLDSHSGKVRYGW